jgi:transcriptional regulator with XRE-family HTH domain
MAHRAEAPVSKKKAVSTQTESFGRRLAQLRKAAGYTQRDLAAELGISQRMVAYYEGQTEHPPAALLPELCRVLKLSADELLGLQSSTKDKLPSGRLWQRFKQVEQLPSKERRELVKLIDLFLERERLRKASGSAVES